MKATQALSDPVDAAIIATARHDAMRLTRTTARAMRTAIIAMVPMMSSMTDPCSGQDEVHAPLRLCVVPGQVALGSSSRRSLNAARANQAQQRVDREGLVQDPEWPELPHPCRVGGDR